LGLLLPLCLGAGGGGGIVPFSLVLFVFTPSRRGVTAFLLRARRRPWRIHVGAVEARRVDPCAGVVPDTIVATTFIVGGGFSRRKWRKVAAAIVLLLGALAASLRRPWFVSFLIFTVE
jgi:hypothetical protein